MHANAEGLAGMFLILDRSEEDHLDILVGIQDCLGCAQAAGHGGFK